MSEFREAFEQFTREQQARDEGIRRSFVLLRDAMLRMQTALDEIHEAATKDHPPSQVPVLLAEIKTMLEAQPAQLVRAIQGALDSRRA